MTYRVFVGWDSRFPEPALVMAHSLKKNSSVPLDVRFLDYAHLSRCYGFSRRPDPLATTEFTYSRFLVPWLCGYAGEALFVDNDMLCLGDVAELVVPGAAGFAVRVVKHDHRPAAAVKFGSSSSPQGSYPRKNWSSVMVMDCARLTAWSKDVVEQAPGSRLHRFQDLPDDQIGDLPPEWNALTHAPPGTKLLHYTDGGPYLAGCEECPHAALWRGARREWLAASGLNPDTPLTPVTLSGPPVT